MYTAKEKYSLVIIRKNECECMQLYIHYGYVGECLGFTHIPQWYSVPMVMLMLPGWM